MKPKLLFVDDELEVLRGLKRALRSKRSEWDLHFANGGQEALDIMQENAADVIVTDMRMPEIDGAKLLAVIAENWPFTRRFILSGQADSEAVRQVIGTSHQFLGKPFDSQCLIAMLEAQLDGDTCEQASRIHAIRALPSHEHTIETLQDLLASESSSIEAIAAIIGDDIALSAKVLQLSNSAYFGTGHATLTPGDAVRTLGFDLLKTLLPKSGFVEIIPRDDACHKEVCALLAQAREAARFADTILAAFPGDIEQPALFRQMCKFLPLGRLLGVFTGAKPIMDGELCLGFAELWGFPEKLKGGLSEIWGNKPLSDDAKAAIALALSLPGFPELPITPDERLSVWQKKFVRLQPDIGPVA